jgi:ankyrin repeat protein
LVQAARRGASKTVKFLCEARADISYKDFLGQTTLHKACISRKKDLVEYLLNDAKVPVDPLDQSQRTPLYFAAERGSLDIVNYLIEKGANVNSLDRRNETALFKPAGNGHVKVVNRLLDAQTDAMILDHWQRTPLRFAAMKGYIDIVRVLLERTKIDQNHPDWVGRTVLHNAAAHLRQGQEQVIDVLFEYNTQPDKYGEKDGGTALYAAIFRLPDQLPPTIALIKRLIKYGVPLDARDKNERTTLFLVAVTGKLDIVELLLSSGAKPNNNSFLAAIRSRSIAFVRPFLKLKSGLNLSERSWSDKTALHIAASGGYNDIVADLLDAKALVRCLDMDEMTPFMSVEKNGRLGAMQLLQNVDLAPTGDIESRVASHLWGRTALHWAVADGQDLEKYILDDSTLNSQDDLRRTALHLAVLSGSLNTIQQLLLAHANMELEDELGLTPLHYSSERVDLAILDALITARANIDAVDKWSRTPLYLAVQNGYSVIARRLLTADAKLELDY